MDPRGCAPTKKVRTVIKYVYILYILLTKTTAAQNEVALSYHRVREFYFLAVVFEATIVTCTAILYTIFESV